MMISPFEENSDNICPLDFTIFESDPPKEARKKTATSSPQR